MKKITTIFERDWNGDRSRVLDQVVPGCEWVFENEGNALRKYDGTCVMFDGEAWWARREVREGKKAPPVFQLIGCDDKTGKAVGWEPIYQSPFAKFHSEALHLRAFPTVGTYELCGPKVQGNPERYMQHVLVYHTLAEEVRNLDRTYEGLRAFFEENDWEGIVFHHPDGRMAKIKARDFGVKR